MADNTLSCQRETLHSQQLRSIKKSIDSDHGIYRVGWEAFLRHVAAGAPLESDFAAGIRDVAFADACHRSMRERTWVALSPAGQV